MTATKRPEPLSCPCKLLPRSLSSFTAAEYGDIHSLSKIRDIASRKDSAGYNPLHFAAQFNHVMATLYLLELGCPVDGGGHIGATPLHRAAFSGALGSMKVLLEWNSPTIGATGTIGGIRGNYTAASGAIRCDLLARDTSFGDESTPLHKAAAGGRFLAVHMLLEALKDRDEEELRNGTSADSTETANDESSWLRRGLVARNKNGLTPLEVAQDLYQYREIEKDSVARWDAVAGGPPDWEKCVALLTSAAASSKSPIHASSRESRNSRSRVSLPSHLSMLGGLSMTCLDCGPNNEGGMQGCSTMRWQQNLHAALGMEASNNMCLLITPNQSRMENDTGTRRYSYEPQQPTRAAAKDSKSSASITGECKESVESLCMKCQKPTIAFYTLPGSSILVCKQCKRSSK